MAYASLDDLLLLSDTARLIDLTDRSVPAAGAIVDAVVERALDDATALADSYLAGRYDLPVSPVPAVLRRSVAAIAYHYLHIDQAPDKVATDAAAAIKWLAQVSAGSAALPETGGTAPSTASGGAVRYSASSTSPLARLRLL